ncbi:hypothetical protein [Thermococcus sp. AM4]|uniref:hypothetical protein n=1 Tax=Thermococcus sp. (strain AM4) TaxID=246969 RepID=UPI000229942B|nr:hypothetical protein [Thermococcus sp. AM4]AEO14029.1 hypothetical protein TAM4_2443 [Thermococcus sp. AM4]
MSLGRKIKSFVEDFKVVILLLMIPVLLILFRLLLTASYILTGGYLLGIIAILLVLLGIGWILKPADVERRI